MVDSRNRSANALSQAAFETLESRKLLASVVLAASTLDAGVNNTLAVVNTTKTTIRVGDNGTNVTEGALVIAFEIPALPAGASITSVTAQFYLDGLANASSIQGDADLYGLGKRSSASVQGSDYYLGAYDGDSTDATALQNALVTKNSPVGAVSLNTNAQTALKNYFTTQYANGAGAGQYLFLRINHQTEQLTSRYWTFATSENATSSKRPTITVYYDVTPAAPSGLSAATTGSGSIALNWTDNASNETGFVIERSSNGTSYTSIGSVGANVTSFNNASGLSADSKYFYRVRAVNGAVASNNSNVANTSTLPTFTNTRWVDSSFVGSSTGSYAAPYKTIASALSAAGAGDGIVLRGGTYKEGVTVNKSVTLMGTPNERATISGFNSVGNWTLLSGSTYTTTLNYKPENLYVGYDPMDLSREPDSSWWTAPTVTAGTGTHTVSDPTHLAGIPSLVGGTIQIHVDWSNTWQTRTITAHNTTLGTITFASVNNLANNDYYIVKNTPNLLDRAGEWATVDNGNGTYTLLFRPVDAGDLNKTQTQSVRTQMIKVDANGAGSTLRNLEVTGNTAPVGGATGYGIYVLGTSNITIRDCIVHNNTGNGIYARASSNVTIRNNIAMANAGGIVLLDVDVSLIHQNDVGFNTNDGVRVTDGSTDVTVSSNYIHDQLGFNHSDGIQLYGYPVNTKIIGNFITRVGQGIMTEEVNSAELTNNVIWNTSGYNVIFGHSNSSNWTVKNNTIGGAGLGTFSMTATGYNLTENVLYNRMIIPSVSAYTGNRNLFFSPSGTPPLRIGTNQNHSTISSWNAATGQDANSQIANPLFNNAPAVVTQFDASNILLFTTTSIYVDSAAGFAVGDRIQINSDGVLRTVTAINGRKITFDVALPMVPLTPYGMVENFKTNTNLSVDLRLSASSPGKTMGATGGPIGSSINNMAFVNGDFNDDGVRDLPTLFSDVLIGLPGPHSWIPDSF